MKIQEQPLKLLLLLAQRPGELVSRDEIRRALWGNGIYVDFEASINFCVNQIRAALRDNSQHPRFLETVPRRGYRFIAPVDKSSEPSATEEDANSVAIVDFQNLTGDPEAAWLGWAIAQTVTVDLQKLTRLRVLSSEKTVLAISSLGLDKVSEKEIPLLKDALPATWVVWGGYQKIGLRIRITAHFSRTATGDSVGSIKADGTMEARSRRYDEALKTGKRGVDLDPRSYMAYYMLGCVHRFRAALEYRGSLFSDAATEFKKSIAAEPNYPWTHLHLGWMCMQHGQYAPAEKFFEEAIAIQDSAGALKAGPRFYGARTLLALLLLRQGQGSRAEELHRRSLAELRECDHVYREVLMAISYCGLGDVAFQRALYEEAWEKFRVAEDLLVTHPGIGAGHILMQALLRGCQSCIALNQTETASRYLERASELLAHKQGFDFGFVWEGWDAQSYYDLAVCQALFGKSEDALTFLKKAVACGWRDHQLLNVDLRLNTIRGTAGFRDLIRALSDNFPKCNGALPSKSEAYLHEKDVLPNQLSTIVPGALTTQESE